MPSVFKIYVHGISDSNMIWRSDMVSDATGYGDSILSPKLKKEINKADGFDFMVLPSNEFYNSFDKKKTFVFVTRDGKCIFRGRVSDVKTDIFKQRTVTCEGDLAFLADSVQSPNKKTNTSDAGDTEKQKRTTLYYGFNGSSSTSDSIIKMSVETYFRGLISAHNSQVSGYSKGFTVGTVNISNKNDIEKFERTSFQDTSSVISSDLLSIYGGVLRTRYENNTAYIDWLDDYTATSGQDIRFGLNMIELDQEAPSDGVWSVLLAVGDDNVTIADANGGSMYLESSEAIAQYGYIVHFHQFNDVKKAAELKAKAQQYLRIHGKVFPDNIIVKAIDLQLIGESNAPLELGERINIISDPHGLNRTMPCIAMELDILNPENNSYTIGTIMPPDKERKKDSLSSQQSSGHNSNSRGIGNNANKIGSMNEDINVNANNINVNAKNIAVNALNVAVNAENIAVVAKNIAIAAETIDIAAQRITATFGTEVDNLHGYIEASAEGIKSSFSDNTTGLSSYFSQKAGEISAGIESADGNIRSKITLTEENLTTEFNKKLYGPSQDGKGGLVADYEHKITTSAESTIETFKKTLYGDGGTEANPTTQSFYYRVRSDTAAESRDYFTKTLYGTDGTPEDPASNTVLYSVYTKSASAWQNALWGEGGSSSNPKNGSILKGTKDAIEARVTKDGVIAAIRLSSEGVKIQAEKVDLGAYATVESLNTTNAYITNLTNGTTVASKIFATDLKTVTGTLSIGDYYNTSAKLKYHDTEYYPVSVSMPNVDSGLVLGSVYRSGTYYSSLNLAHSHSVSTSSNGTITLGGTVSVSNAGSFRIADTKTYKDGVSAARTEGINSVSVSYVSKLSSNYNSYYTEYNVKVNGVASNGNSKEDNFTVDAIDAYNDGKNSVGVSSVTVTDVIDTYDDDWRHDCADIYLSILLDNGETKNYTLYEVPMWKVYNQGRIDAITTDSYCESITVSSDGSGHATIAAWLSDSYGDYRTYHHYVQANSVNDYHN